MTNKYSATLIRCRATSLSGSIASFYDIHQNKILDQAPVFCKEWCESCSNAPVKCFMRNGYREKHMNILEMAGIEDHLRLRVYLNEDCNRNLGMLSINAHPEPFHEHTRFLYYSWIQRQLSLSEKTLEQIHIDKLSWNTSQATHLITGIEYGIDLIIIAQLSDDDQNVLSIDQQLEKIKTCLVNGEDISSILHDEDFQKIGKINAYSNVPELSGPRPLSYVLSKIKDLRQRPNIIHPMNYLLHPIHLFLSRSIHNIIQYQSLSPEIYQQIEQHVLTIRSLLIRLRFCQRQRIRYAINIPSRHGNFLMNIEVQKVESECKEDIQRLAIQVRKYETGQIPIDNLMTITHFDRNWKERSAAYVKTMQNVYLLQEKYYFIKSLNQRYFTYQCIVNTDVGINDDERTIEEKLVHSNSNIRVFCSTDALNRADPLKFKELQDFLFKMYLDKPYLRLIYADFSYCNYPLRSMMILPKQMNDTEQDAKLSQTEKEDDLINVLLIGETGVGKSTFVNALVNYLTFESLEQAENNEPLVYIPVSFLVTTGFNFQDQIVTYGKGESLKNEDFNDQGQSVTQHCRSYTFYLPSNKTQQIRIIDTPGFGDTRGIEQDKINIQHALDYVKNISHLDAICVLLKPNESRMNISFRICFNQLFSLLDSNAHQNIIFCFTNARSTFYAPGDTSILLQNMLQNSNMTHEIKFERTNSFCFDNEAFRYLVAKYNGIQFSDDEQKEYERSWQISVRESQRLLEYIKSLKPAKRQI